MLNDIDTVLKKFVWTGTDLKKFGAKVAWNEVYTPKKGGGGGGDIGIKNIGVWNKACMVRHL